MRRIAGLLAAIAAAPLAPAGAAAAQAPKILLPERPECATCRIALDTLFELRRTGRDPALGGQLASVVRDAGGRIFATVYGGRTVLVFNKFGLLFRQLAPIHQADAAPGVLVAALLV